MNTLRLAFGVDVGYSDHTAGIEVSVAAVALGATVIEKHITLKNNDGALDSKFSLDSNKIFEFGINTFLF